MQLMILDPQRYPTHRSFDNSPVRKLAKSTDTPENFPWCNKKKVQAALYQHANLSDDEIDKITDYVATRLSSIVAHAVSQKQDRHLRPSTTNLPLPIDISLGGFAQLLLKKFGEMTKEGGFRKTQLAITLSHHELQVTAHSTQGIFTNDQKEISDREIKILKKIAAFLAADPNAKGLLQFFSSSDYQDKNLQAQLDSDGYDANSSFQNIPYALNLKRGITTKYYSFGTLEENLDSLSLHDRIKVGEHILMGLKHLHGMKIFHSDLKLDNIFLEWDEAAQEVDEAVIGDFGFSCDLSDPADRFYKNGHRSHRAPELLECDPIIGRAIDENIFAADIFALGLLLKELFANHSDEHLEDLIEEMTAEQLELRPTASDAYLRFYAIFIGIASPV